MDEQGTYKESLLYIYQRCRGLITEELNKLLGNIVSGGKIAAGAIPVDGTTITITTGGGGGQVISSGGGTVTSIGVTVPTSVLTVSPSSITGSGTFAFTLATQVANTVWAGPTTGIAATPTFRGLVSADIPSLDAAKIATGTFAGARIPVDNSTIVISGGAVTGNYTGGTGITISGRTISASGGGTLPTVGTTGQAIVSDGTEWAAATASGFGGLWDPTSVDGGIPYRNLHSVTALTVGFGGDSITAGTLVTTAPPVTCAGDLSSAEAAISANNQGVSGATSADWVPGAPAGYLATALAAWASAGATIAHFMLGTNDAKTSVATTATQYRANVLLIAQACVNVGITPVFSYPVYLNTTSSSFDGASPGRVAGYCAQLDLLVDNGWIVQGDTLSQAYFKANTSALQGDGVHPTQAGSDYLAGLWAAALRRIVQARVGLVAWKQLTIGSGLAIVGDVLSATAVSPLTTKGDVFGFDSAAARIPAANVNGNVLTEDSTAPTGWRSKPLPSVSTTLASLADVTLRDLQDGDVLTWVDVLGVWMNTTGIADYGANVVDGGVLVTDGGVQVIEDPLPVGVSDGGVAVVDGGQRVIV